MPPITRAGAKKNSKSKEEKRPRSLSKSETEKGPDDSQIIKNTIYFFRPKEPHGYLSQWYTSTFTDGMYSYENAEQYMMHLKGILFAPDSSVTSSILETTNPRGIKNLGRMIPGFDEVTWKRERLNIVIEGSRLKFRQSEALKAQLLATEDKELVEASPFDRIWGVGFGAKQAPLKRSKWGENLLGKALMAVRRELQEEAFGDNIDSVPAHGLEGDPAGGRQPPEVQRSIEDPSPPNQRISASPSSAQAKVIFSLLLLNLVLFYI